MRVHRCYITSTRGTSSTRYVTSARCAFPAKYISDEEDVPLVEFMYISDEDDVPCRECTSGGCYVPCRGCTSGGVHVACMYSHTM